MRGGLCAEYSFLIEESAVQRVSVHGSPALSHGFDGFIDYLQDQEARASALSPKRFGEVFEKILLSRIRKLIFSFAAVSVAT